jgi:hypothetical protein
MISVTHARPILSSEKEHVCRAKEVTEFNLELLSPNTFCYNFAGEKADRARSAPARSKAKAKTSGGAAREKHFPSARINFAQLRAVNERARRLGRRRNCNCNYKSRRKPRPLFNINQAEDHESGRD